VTIEEWAAVGRDRRDRLRAEMLAVLHARGIDEPRASDFLAEIRQVGGDYLEGLGADAFAYEASKLVRPKTRPKGPRPRAATRKAHRRPAVERDAFWGFVLSEWRATGLEVSGFDAREHPNSADLNRFLHLAAEIVGFEIATPDAIRSIVAAWRKQNPLA
jgi:hypothetical protein